MPVATITIGSTSGLHARPASTFVKAAAASGADVQIAKGAGASVNAASLLSVLALGARHGDEVTLTVSGDDDRQVLEDLSALLASDLDAA